jgi:hypothetical protein
MQHKPTKATVQPSFHYHAMFQPDSGHLRSKVLVDSTYSDNFDNESQNNKPKLFSVHQGYNSNRKPQRGDMTARHKFAFHDHFSAESS